jgi:hypothetical protein
MINQLLKQATNGQPEPKIGMGATILSYSDRYPGTIFRVFTFRKCIAVEVREDEYTLKDHYLHTSKVNIKGHRRNFVFKNNMWVELVMREGKLYTGSKRGLGLRIGDRQAYYDPHF